MSQNPKNLREESNAFNIHMQQLTLPYLLSGYYPRHSLLVAIGCLVLSASFVCIPVTSSSRTVVTAQGNHTAPVADAAPSSLLFTSVTSFAATVMCATLALTALYRMLTLDNKNASTRMCGAVQQSDFLIDVVLKESTKWVAQTLLEGSTVARATFIASISVCAELGNVLGSTAAVGVVLSLGWIGFLVYTHYLPAHVKAALRLPTK